MAQLWRTVLLLVLTLSLGACSALRSLDPAKLPVPGNYITGGFHVLVDFKSVLNLPERAKVISNGVKVGVLEAVTLDPRTGHVEASLHLQQGVQIPGDATVQIRQATLFGDTYLSVLSPPGSAQSFLGDGSVINIDHTQSGDQIEDVLRGISDLVTGGSIVDLNRLAVQAIAEFPGKDELARLRDVLFRTLGDLAHNTPALDNLLQKVLAVITKVADNREDLDKLTVYGPKRFAGAIDVFNEVHRFFLALDYPAMGFGDLLIPYIRDLHDMLGAGKVFTRELSRFDLTFPYNLERLKGFFANYLLPYWLGGEENVEVERYVPDGSPEAATGPIADNVINSLRLLGVLR